MYNKMNLNVPFFHFIDECTITLANIYLLPAVFTLMFTTIIFRDNVNKLKLHF